MLPSRKRKGGLQMSRLGVIVFLLLGQQAWAQQSDQEAQFSALEARFGPL